jgi:hypothetical protein
VELCTNLVFTISVFIVRGEQTDFVTLADEDIYVKTYGPSFDITVTAHLVLSNIRLYVRHFIA